MKGIPEVFFMSPKKEDLVVFSVKIDKKIKEAFYNFLKARYGENFRGNIRYEVENMIGSWIAIHRFKHFKEENNVKFGKDIITLTEHIIALTDRLEKLIEKMESKS